MTTKLVDEIQAERQRRETNAEQSREIAERAYWRALASDTGSAQDGRRVINLAEQLGRDLDADIQFVAELQAQKQYIAREDELRAERQAAFDAANEFNHPDAKNARRKAEAEKTFQLNRAWEEAEAACGKCRDYKNNLARQFAQNPILAEALSDELPTD